MSRTPDYVDVAPEVVAAVRAICEALPETTEEPAWAGRRWLVRKRPIVHLLAIDSAEGPKTLLVFRSSEPELGVLRKAGHPFFETKWGHNAIGMVVDDDVDWDEVAELLTESYCVQAPKKLAALVDRPPEVPIAPDDGPF